MTSTTGIATAPSPAARTIRCRSGRLAKRHNPRYRPKARKMPACKGRIQASVCHMSVSCGSCKSMFARSQYRPAQASAAAQTSCTNASHIRQLALTFLKPRSSPAPEEIQALRRINLRIAAAEFVAISGKSGCGKSTLLHIIGGLEPATSGQVVVDGHNLARLPEPELTRFRRDRVGVGCQSFN